MANQVSQHAGKYARFELERRFLVEHLPEGIEQGRGWRITDRYIKDTQLRLRRMEPIHGGHTIFKLGQKQVPSPPGFDTAEEMDEPLDLPSWIPREVSNDSRFTGGALASLTPDGAAELIRHARS